MMKFLKKSISISFALLAMLATSFFAFSLLKNKTINAVSAASEIQNANSASISVPLGESNSKVKPMSATSGGSQNLSWDVGSVGNIQGGTTIKVSSASATEATISFSPAGATASSATVEVKPGYRLTLITITGSETEKIEFDYTNKYDAELDNAGTITSFSTTPEALFPAYPNQSDKIIQFTAECEAITYKLDMFYVNNYEDVDDDRDLDPVYASTSIDYTVEGETFFADNPNTTEVESSKVVTNAAGETSAVWLLKHSGNATGDTISINNIKFTCNPDSVTDINGHKYYYIYSVQGYVTLDQSANKKVVAKWGNTYTLKVNLGISVWSQEGYKSANSDNSLAGVETNNPDNTIQIKDHDDYNLIFLDSKVSGTESLSFKKKDVQIDSYKAMSDSGNYYYVYNFGYKITKWTISFKFNNNTYYLELGDSGWTHSTNENERKNLVLDLGNDGRTQAIAKYLDDKFVGGLEGGSPQNFSFQMTPVWAPVTIDVVWGKGTETTEDDIIWDGLTYNDIDGYSLSGLITPPTGQSLMAFKAIYGEKSTIATTGTWNYYKDLDTEYVYNGGSDRFTLNVEPVYVDNIYKIKLGAPKSATLENTDYNFSNSTSYGYEIYTFDSTNTTGTDERGYSETGVYSYSKHSPQTQPLIDDYIGDLNGYISTYNDGIQIGDDTDSVKFDILRKIYENTTETYITINGEVKEEKEFYPYYIYLANNQTIGNLPVFTEPYYQLIFWETDDLENGITSHTENDTAYLTTEYGTNVAEFKADLGNPDPDSENPCFSNWSSVVNKNSDFDKQTWSLSHMQFSGGTIKTLLPHYFRKNYTLNLNTYLTKESTDTLSRVGWIDITITDNVDGSKGGNYIAICDGSAMKIYEADSLEDTQGKTAIVGLKLYAGCSIEISAGDQSQDTDAMNSGDFDELIGYRFTKMDTTSKKGEDEKPPLFTNFEKPTYSVKIEDKEGNKQIEGKNYPSGTIITINAYFKLINYSFNLSIDQYAGRFVVTHGSSVSSKIQNYTFDFNVQSASYKIDYKAYAGYENLNLLWEDSGNVENFTKNGQEYSLPNDNNWGTWLRLNYYNNDSISDTDVKGYSVSKTMSEREMTLGTQAFSLNVGIKLYDSTDSTLIASNGILKSLEAVGTIKLENGQKPLQLTLSSDLNIVDIDETEDRYMYILAYDHDNNAETPAIEYVLYSSRRYIPNNMTTTNGNDYATFDFPLTSSPEINYNLNSTKIAQMVNSQAEIVIPEGSRQIYILIEVRKLIEVTMQVEMEGDVVGSNYNSKDANASTRTTSVTTDKNVTSLDITSGATAQIKDNKIIFDSTGKAYSFVGASNRLSSSFNTAHYDRVEYYIDGSKLDVASFTATEDKTLTIKYVVKTVNVSVEYYVDGTKQAGIPTDYIEVTTLPLTRPYYANEVVQFAYNLVNTDYEVKLYVNNEFNTNLNSLNLTVDSTHLNAGEIILKVEINKRSNSDVVVELLQYVDAHDNRSMPGDELGAVDLIVNNESVTAGVGGTRIEANVVVGKSVKVDLSKIAKGYKVKSWKHDANSMVNLTGSETELEIANSVMGGYDVNSHKGTYYIYVEKVDISVEWDLTSSRLSGTEQLAKQYMLTSSTATATLTANKLSLTKEYLGKEITLTATEHNLEVVDKLYYLKGATKVYLEKTVNADLTTATFKITPELMVNVVDYSIELGVEFTPKYKLNISYVGEEFIAEKSTKLGENDYELGTYVVKDSVVKLNLTPNDYADGDEEYNISITGDIETSAEILTDYEIILNSDKALTITLTPKEFTNSVTEYLYETLPGLENGIKTPVDVSQVNGVSELKGLYKSTKQVFINRHSVQADRELCAIELEGNENLGTIRIEFNGSGILKMVHIDETGETTIEDLNPFGYKLSFVTIGTSEKVLIEYTILDAVSISCEYATYVDITPAK